MNGVVAYFCSSSGCRTFILLFVTMSATVGCARDDNDEPRRGADLVDNSVNYGVASSFVAGV